MAAFKLLLNVILVSTLTASTLSQNTDDSGSHNICPSDLSLIYKDLLKVTTEVNNMATSHSKDVAFLYQMLNSLTLRIEVLGSLTSTNDSSYHSDSSCSCNSSIVREIIDEQMNIILKNVSQLASSNQDAINSLNSTVYKFHNKPTPLPSSCYDIKVKWPDSSSGFYLIGGNKPSYVYCNMAESCGSDEGWTRLAYLDMSDTSEECPTGFRLYASNGVKACGRPYSSVGSCQSIQFPSNGISYSQVCGRVVGYQYGSPDAVYPGRYQLEEYGSVIDASRTSINSYYVDGISLTHGSPRQHVWTFVAGLQENFNYKDGRYQCPCSVGSKQLPSVQSFIGNDYFCESGCPGRWTKNTPYFSDPLWDGKQCGYLEQACCQASGLSWFHKVLNYTTTDYIELRVCGDEGTINEDVPVNYYEIYVK